jgi:hypothetical protein
MPLRRRTEHGTEPNGAVGHDHPAAGEQRGRLAERADQYRGSNRAGRDAADEGGQREPGRASP